MEKKWSFFLRQCCVGREGSRFGTSWSVCEFDQNTHKILKTLKIFKKLKGIGKMLVVINVITKNK